MCNLTRGIEDGGVRCANGGECVDGLGDSYTCICAPGWTGDTCQQNIDECQENPCLNDGHCMDMIGMDAVAGLEGSQLQIYMILCLN